MGLQEDHTHVIEAGAAVNGNERLELVAMQLAIALAHDPNPVEIDMDRVAAGGQTITMQRVLSIEERLKEEVDNERRLRQEHGVDYDPDILTEREQAFMPAARIIVGLMHEASTSSRKRSGR